jgi:hypothetical protein
MSSCMEYQLGPACALEELFEALLRFLSVALYPAVAASERIPFDKSTRKQAIAFGTNLPMTRTGESTFTPAPPFSPQ